MSKVSFSRTTTLKGREEKEGREGKGEVYLFKTCLLSNRCYILTAFLILKVYISVFWGKNNVNVIFVGRNSRGT